MEYAAGLVTSVIGLYKTINPSTLSGVNDIIVIDHNGTLKCSPFQVRFGKLRMFRITSRTVHIYVNGKMADVSMTIGKEGELYFQEQQSSLPPLNINYSSEIYEDKVMSDGEFQFVDKKSYKKYNTKRLVEIERKSNNDKRIFAMSRQTVESIASNHRYFSSLFDSAEYFTLLRAQLPRLIHVLIGMITNPIQKDKCDGLECNKTLVRFSLCLNQKINKGIEEIFDGYEIHIIRDHEKVVVKVEGCVNFYFPFKLFTEIFFLIKNYVSKKGKSEKVKNEIFYLIAQISEREIELRTKNSFFGKTKPEKKSLVLTNDELKKLDLKYGINEIVFKLSGLDQKITGRIFLWKNQDKIIISDIDGTITKSDVRGHFYTFMGKDWTHSGVVTLYKRLFKNGYKILYLTTRPIGQSPMTRLYLNNITQDGGILPEGPIIHSPDGVFVAIYREIISRNPQLFKIACLEQIKSLFSDERPFVSGFGNKPTDVMAYKHLGIPTSKIFTINPQGNIYLELTKALTATHYSLNNFVDVMFPVLSSGVSFENEYRDEQFWSFYNNDDKNK